MAKRLLLGIFLIFLVLVGLNYLYTVADGYFSTFASSGPVFDPGPGSSRALTAIHFNIFGKGGGGSSYVSQGYGHTPFSYSYPGDWHDGIDIAATYGAPVYSPVRGVVLATGNQDNYCWHRGFGMYVALYDPANNIVLWFAHLGTIAVAPGEQVAKDARLATVGATGFETGTHLHFSIFDGDGFSVAGIPGCGPGPTASDHDRNPLSYLVTVNQ